MFEFILHVFITRYSRNETHRKIMHLTTAYIRLTFDTYLYLNKKTILALS